MSGFKINSNNNINDLFKSVSKEEDLDDIEETSVGNEISAKNEPIVHTKEKVVEVESKEISKATINKIITLSENIDSLGDNGKAFLSTMLIRTPFEPGEEDVNKVDSIYGIVNVEEVKVKHAQSFINAVNTKDRVERVFFLLEFNEEELKGISEITSLVSGNEIVWKNSKETTKEVELHMEEFFESFTTFFEEHASTLKEIFLSLSPNQ